MSAAADFQRHWHRSLLLHSDANADGSPATAASLYSIESHLSDASRSRLPKALASLIIQYSDVSVVGKPGHGLHRSKQIQFNSNQWSDASRSRLPKALASLIIQYSDVSAVGKPGHGLHRFQTNSIQFN